MNRSTRISRTVTALLAVHFLIVLAGCAPSNDVVDWPELKALDPPSAKAEGLARKGQTDALRALLPEVASAARAVSTDTMPANAENESTVEVLLGDLAEMTAMAEDPIALSDDDVLALGSAFHSMVGELMKESGMPHLHEGEGPNGGYLHPLALTTGEVVGQVEIKLHDDAGDIEVWLTRGQTGAEPIDLPLATVIAIAFPEREGRAVELRVRNEETNEDEDGVSTIRESRTNYFIFPGETGTDPSWLTGTDFAAEVRITFDDGPTQYVAGPFELKPHVH